MKEVFYSSEVCQQLASDLVKEQAQLVKHEALVKELKAKIVDGKKQFIKKLIEGRDFLLGEKKKHAFGVVFAEVQECLNVKVVMGLDPDDTIMPSSMTKREEEIVEEYEALFYYCQDYFYENAGDEAERLQRTLNCLKNGISLVQTYSWEIDFGNATTPGFFEQSGLDVCQDNGCYMLEDLEYRK